MTALYGTIFTRPHVWLTLGLVFLGVPLPARAQSQDARAPQNSAHFAEPRSLSPDGGARGETACEPGEVIQCKTVWHGLLDTGRSKCSCVEPPPGVDPKDLPPATPEIQAMVGGGKGERGKTAKPSGTPNEFKKMRQHPTKPNKVLFEDPHTGKEIEKAKPPGFDEWVQSKRER